MAALSLVERGKRNRCGSPPTTIAIGIGSLLSPIDALLLPRSGLAGFAVPALGAGGGQGLGGVGRAVDEPGGQALAHQEPGGLDRLAGPMQLGEIRLETGAGVVPAAWWTVTAGKNRLISAAQFRVRLGRQTTTAG